MKEYENLDKRLALLEQKLDLVLENHLTHMEKDMRMIKGILGATALAVFVQFLAVLTGMV
jgi:hypothetical protein